MEDLMQNYHFSIVIQEANTMFVTSSGVLWMN